MSRKEVYSHFNKIYGRIETYEKILTYGETWVFQYGKRKAEVSKWKSPGFSETEKSGNVELRRQNYSNHPYVK
jgi:hypothetical protein